MGRFKCSHHGWSDRWVLVLRDLEDAEIAEGPALTVKFAPDRRKSNWYEPMQGGRDFKIFKVLLLRVLLFGQVVDGEGRGVVVEVVVAVDEEIVVEAVEEFPGLERAPGEDTLAEGVEGPGVVACLGDAVGVEQQLVAGTEGVLIDRVDLGDEQAQVEGRCGVGRLQFSDPVGADEEGWGWPQLTMRTT